MIHTNWAIQVPYNRLEQGGYGYITSYPAPLPIHNLVVTSIPKDLYIYNIIIYYENTKFKKTEMLNLQLNTNVLENKDSRICLSNLWINRKGGKKRG